MLSKSNILAFLATATLCFIGGRTLSAPRSTASSTQPTVSTRPTASALSKANVAQGFAGRASHARSNAPELLTQQVIKNDKWTSLRKEHPSKTSAITNALVMEMSKSVHLSGKSPYDCNIDGQLIGVFALEFKVKVESNANQLRASEWRFAGIRTGSPLSSQAVQCFEQLLNKSTTISSAEGAFLDGYAGEVPMTYRINFAPGE